jgi:hypothetical protein
MGSDSTSRRRFFTLFASARKSSAMAKHYPETTVAQLCINPALPHTGNQRCWRGIFCEEYGVTSVAAT